MELREFKKALRVIDTIIAESDEEADIWYLAAFCNFESGNIKSSRECLVQVATLLKKHVDFELEAAARELADRMGEPSKDEQDADDDWESCDEEEDEDMQSEEEKN